MNGAGMNILIVKTSAIGDVLHTLPALHALRRRYPEAHISWLVEEEASDIVLGHPALDQVLISARKRWLRDLREGDRLSALREIVRLIRSLRSRRYDLLIDFQGLLKSSMFITCCRATRKVGFGRGMAHSEGSYLFLSERVPPVTMDTHAVDRELMLLEAIGIPAQGVEFTLPLGPHDHLRANELLTAHGLAPGAPFIAINPMTTWPTKHWQATSFAELTDALLRQGRTVVFTGGQGDHAAIAELCGRLGQPGAINLAGATTLKTLAAVYTKATLLITTDTGPMHLAAAVHTPVVALFGPTAPWRTGPYGAGHRVIRKELPCSPCLKRVCRFGTTECMRAITVDEVLAAVAEIGLERQGG